MIIKVQKIKQNMYTFREIKEAMYLGYLELKILEPHVFSSQNPKMAIDSG